MAKAKIKRKPRATKVEMAERAERQRKYDYDMGLRDGIRQTEAKRDEDRAFKLLEARIKFAQHLGQMIEATARAVTTFVGEEGLRG